MKYQSFDVIFHSLYKKDNRKNHIGSLIHTKTKAMLRNKDNAGRIIIFHSNYTIDL